MSAPETEDLRRVSALELFFDLVFVFTITQLTTVLANEPTWRGLLQAVLMLGVIWWMYDGYAWLTNAVAPDLLRRRLVLLGGMAGFLVLALATPHAFSGAGEAFGIAYVVIVAIHAGLFIRETPEDVTRAILTLAPYNLVTALLVLAGGLAGGTAQYVLWALAFVGEWASAVISETEGYNIAPAHFVERHALVVIVALGESVVAVGIGAAGLPIDLELVGVAVLGLLLAACLWWAYFGEGEDAPERALAAAPRNRRPRMALNAFGYAFLPLLFGIIAVAAALKQATGHPFDDLEPARALQLSGGVAAYLLGDALFRASLHLARAPWRMAAGVLALAAIPLGTQVSAVAQIAAIVVVLAGALALEQARPATAAQPALRR